MLKKTPVAHFAGLKCCYSEKHTLYIRYQLGEFLASVEPCNRRNGTQTWDGLLPRRYKSLRGAKVALGKLLDSGLVWEPVEEQS